MGKKHGAGKGKAVAPVGPKAGPKSTAVAAPVPTSNGLQAMDVDDDGSDSEQAEGEDGEGSFSTEDSFVSAEEMTGEDSSSPFGSDDGEDDEGAWEDEESSGDEDDDSDADGDADTALEKIMALVEPDEIAQEELKALTRLQAGEEDEADGLDGGEEGEEEEEEEEGEEYEGLPPGSDNEDLAASIKRRVIKNDEAALDRLLEHMKPGSALGLDFFETQTLSHDESLSIPDVHDDITREVELYKVALSAATRARSLYHASSKPFTRPADYFAEMLKSDAAMEKVRSRLLDEQARIKASEEARRQRGLKKFGKEVQTKRRLDREKESKRVKDGVDELRKKRKGGALDGRGGQDEFEIALDDALEDDRRPLKRPRPDGPDARRGGRGAGAFAGRGGGRGGRGAGSRMPRSAREEKFGRPKPVGAGRRFKENTKESSGSFAGFGGKGDGRRGFASGGRGGFGGRGGRGGRGGAGRGGAGRGGKSRGGGAKRPGKSKRVARG